MSRRYYAHMKSECFPTPIERTYQASLKPTCRCWFKVGVSGSSNVIIGRMPAIHDIGEITVEFVASALGARIL
jgi:hypothetical protein